MKVNKPFNQFTKQEYLEAIPNHRQYSNFNTLGLYRSLLENENLSMAEKLEVRGLAHTYFQKTFDFLQLKDPFTYLKVYHLGEELTRQQENAFWQTIQKNQQKILKDKKMKHRNFGSYAKHNCGYENCPYNGLMIKQGSGLAEMSMCFDSDHHGHEKKLKAARSEKERQKWRKFMVTAL
jgi:hypothetical protein